jgi:hypothetical protein
MQTFLKAGTTSEKRHKQKKAVLVRMAEVGHIGREFAF